MTNRTSEANAMAFTFVASDRRTIRTCPTSMDGATERVEDNVRSRTSVDVVWGGSGAGNLLEPSRYRPDDGGGITTAH